MIFAIGFNAVARLFSAAGKGTMGQRSEERLLIF